jgi:hypothetical protein
MKSSLSMVLFLLFILFVQHQSMAQHLVDGFSKGKGKLDVALSYTRENFKEFYLGDTKKSITIRDLDQIITESVNLYASYGLTNTIDINVNIPYIATKSHRLTNNEKVGDKNLQNALLVVEWKAYEKEVNNDAFSVTGGLGFSTPLSNYPTNLIYSIGNQSSHINPSVLVQYKFANGLFVNGQGGYSFRTNKVPDAVLSAARIGFAGKLFYVEGWVNNQTSTTGIDIGGPGFTPARFPETRVNTTNVGASVFIAGVTIGGGKRLAGRNAGLPNFYTVGLAYSF